MKQVQHSQEICPLFASLILSIAVTLSSHELLLDYDYDYELGLTQDFLMYQCPLAHQQI